MKKLFKIVCVFILMLFLVILTNGSFYASADYPYYGFLMTLKYAGIRFDDPQNSADNDYGVLDFYQNLETPTENQDIFALNFSANTTTDVKKTIHQIYTQAYNMDDASGYGGRMDLSAAVRGESGAVCDFLTLDGDATTWNPSHDGALVVNANGKDIDVVMLNDDADVLFNVDAATDSVNILGNLSVGETSDSPAQIDLIKIVGTHLAIILTSGDTLYAAADTSSF